MLERIDAAFNAVIDHWLGAMNWLLALYVALPVAAPILTALGAHGPAEAIYRLYSYTCHQEPTHSWYLFGQKMAYCQRDTAIYGAMFLGGLAYARRRRPGLPFWAFVLLSLPIALDGGAATLGVRDSTPLLRTLTGTLFGLAVAWFVYPLMDRALDSLRLPVPGRDRVGSPADGWGGDASREPATGPARAP
jgi:uncharacterized membrane protein